MAMRIALNGLVKDGNATGHALAGAAVVTAIAVAVVLGLRLGAGAVSVSAPGARTASVSMHAEIARPMAVASRHAAVPAVDAFAEEQRLSFGQLMKRWDPDISRAAKRFDVPAPWIRAVMQIESGGRTMMGEHQPIVSDKGAEGLMQLMPATYDEMRTEYALGSNPFDPHDNIEAGAAYLKWLRGKYGYPQMFAAYNDGPGHLDERLAHAQLLPPETRNYLVSISATLSGRSRKGAALATFTRPNGTQVTIDASAVLSVRAALPDEYAPGVQAVIAVGTVKQGVRESLASARAILRAHGGAV